MGTVRDAGKAKVVPLSKVSIAFGAGLAGAGGKAEKEGGGSDAGLEGGGAGGAILVEPKAGGFKLVVYLLPLVVVAVGGLVIWRAVKKWTAPVEPADGSA